MFKLLLFFTLLLVFQPLQSALNESTKPNHINVYLQQNPPFSAFNVDQKPQGLLVDYWQLWSHFTGIPVTYILYVKQDLTLLSSDDPPAVYNGLDVANDALSKLEKQRLFVIYSRFYYPPLRAKEIAASRAENRTTLSVGGLLPEAQKLPLFSTQSHLLYKAYPGLLDLLIAIYTKQVDALVLFEGERQKSDSLRWLLSLLLEEQLSQRVSNDLFVYAPKAQKNVLEWIHWGSQLEMMPDKTALAITNVVNPIWGGSAEIQTKLLMVFGGIFLLLLFIRFRRKKDYQFKTLLDSSPYPVVIFSLDGAVIYYCNDCVKSLFPLKKINHKYVFDDPENQFLLSRFINKASHKILIEENNIRLLVDGRFHDFELSGKRVYYRRKMAWLCYLKDIDALLRAEQKLTEERTLLRKVLDSIPEQIFFKSAKGSVIGCNKAWAKANNTTVSKATGRRLLDLISVDLINKQEQQDKAVWVGGDFKEQSWKQQENSELSLINIVKLPLYNDKGSIFAILSIESDMTDLYSLNKKLKDENLQRRKTEIALSKQNILLSTVFAASIDPIALLDKNGLIIGANNAFAILMGSNPIDIIGKSQGSFLSAENGDWTERQNIEVIESGKPLIFEELSFFKGKKIWYEVSKTPFKDDENHYQGIVIMARDITLRKQTEEKLSSEALDFELKMLHDPLTGIANRRAFDLQLEKLWKEACEQKKLLSIVMCDVDFFKSYNDNYGHQKGDLVLHDVAQALERTCEKADCFVARYGGEEFVALIKGESASNALEVAEALREAVANAKIEHLYSAANSFVTISLGLSTMRPSGENAMPMLLAEADSAMYDAKKLGRNKICIY